MSASDILPARNHIWDDRECLPRRELEDLQLSRLRSLLERVAHVPYYKRAFTERKVAPGVPRH